MRTVFKKFIPFIIILAIILSALTVSVAAAGSSVAFSKNTLIVGENLIVTARFSTSSSDAMFALEGYITYDPNVLEWVSGDNCNMLTAGKVKIVMQSAGKTNLTETINFKSLKAGTSTIALENLVYVNKDDEEKNLSGCSAVVTVTNPSTQASSNTNLKNISTSSGTLTPKFNPDVTSYSVTIANDVEELWLSVSKGDTKQTYVVEGSRNMKVGLNKRVVVVTAENGDTKKYTVNITRLDGEGQYTDPSTEGDEPLNDLSEVIVGDQVMYVVEDLTGAELPQNFQIIEYAFDGKTIPALSDSNYIILALRLPDNSARDFYVYDKDGVFTKLITVSIGGQNFQILPTDEVPEGYSAVNDFTIGEVVVPAYKSDKAGLGDFALVYAKGPGGQTGFYSYDTVDNTIQRVVELGSEEDAEQVAGDTENQKTDIITSFMELNTNGKIVVITILAIIVLLIAAIIVLIVKIASSGKADDDFEEEDFEEELFDDDNGIVGFEYVSMEDNNTEQAEENTPEEETETTEESEESDSEE